MCCHGGPGNILISLNTHESSSLPSPPAYPGFSNGQLRCSVYNPPYEVFVGTPLVLFFGRYNYCQAAFPHLAALPRTAPVVPLFDCVADSTFSPTDILASIALESFNSGPSSGALSVCEAGYAMVPFDGPFSGTMTASSRTIFSFP